MSLEELNYIICENGLNFRLPCISNIFKHFPGAWSLHKPQLTLPFKITHGSLSPSYILPSCKACCLPFPDKNKRKNIVLTQHSVNVHTKPLSEKQTVLVMWGSHLM